MSTRAEVYAAIEGELDYAERIWQSRAAAAGEPYRPDDTKTTEEWLVFILGYYNDTVSAASHQAGPGPTLHFVRKLASLSIRCMLSNAVVFRAVRDGDGDVIRTVIREPGLHDVYAAINKEREYQNALGPDRTDRPKHSIGGYLVMFKTYLDRAFDAWTENPGDVEALDNIRKLAGIAVRCLEDHGAPLREVTGV